MIQNVCILHKTDLLRFLLRKTAAVRRGVKPGELLRVRRCFMAASPDGTPVCLHRRDILRILELDYVELLVEAESSLVLFYHADTMAAALGEPDSRAILEKCGYDMTADCAGLLAQLGRRFRAGGGLPHEVGVFLGYPAKDVSGFMANLPRTPVEHGRWAVYGDAGESLVRMRLYRRIETAAESLLNVCGDPQAFFQHISHINPTTGVIQQWQT